MVLPPVPHPEKTFPDSDGATSLDDAHARSRVSPARARQLLALKWIATCALVGVVCWRTDRERALALLADVHVELLALAFLLLFVERATVAARLPLMVRAAGHRLSFLQAYRIDLISLFFQISLPSNFTGDAVRGWRLFKITQDLKSSMLAIVFDRVVGFVTLSVAAIGALAWGWRLFGAETFAIGVTALGLLLALPAAVIAAPQVIALVERLAPRLMALGAWRGLVGLHDGFQKLRRESGLLARVGGLSLLTQSCRIAVVYLVALALGPTLPPVYFVLFLPIAMLAKMLPLSFGGVGVREVTFAMLFASAGRPSAEGLVVGFLISILSVTFALCGGMIYLMDRLGKPQPS